MSASFVNKTVPSEKLMESVLHLSFLLSFVETSGMLSQNQFHHNHYIHPRTVLPLRIMCATFIFVTIFVATGLTNSFQNS